MNFKYNVTKIKRVLHKISTFFQFLPNKCLYINNNNKILVFFLFLFVLYFLISISFDDSTVFLLPVFCLSL